MNVPVFVPLLEKEEIESAVRSLEEGWLGMGKYVGQFEKEVEDMFGKAGMNVHAVAVSTGHAALHLALMDLGVQDGDEIITPSFNNIADFQAIIATGAVPVFCDIDPQTLCADPESVKRLIGPKTKAIIIMDYACHLCDYDAFLRIEKDTGIPVIHDAAHSFGGYYKGKPVGGLFGYTMFSFDPVKNVTCIDGGMLLVKDTDTVTRLREMRLIGMGQPSEVMYQNKRAWTYDVKRLGFRYHMANLHAAVGLSQLHKIDIIHKTREQAFAKYNENLKSLKYLSVPAPNPADARPLPFIFFLRIHNALRQGFIDFMKARHIDTGIHWQAGHYFSLFRHCRKDDLPVTEQIVEEIITLPFHSKMSPENQDAVIAAVKDFSNEL